MQVAPAQVETVCSLLARHRDTLVAQIWPLLESSNSDQQAQLLHVASALTMYDASNTEKWNAVAKRVADRIVSENPLRLAVWLDTLRPVRQYLVPPLSDVFRSDPSFRRQSEIDLATNVLEDDVDQLSELIVDAQPKQIAALFDELKTHGVPAKDKILATLELKPIPAVKNEQLAKRQANAAAALARLGHREKIFTALRITDDPESLTQFVHRCSGSGVTASELWSCVEIANQSRQSLTGESRRIEDRVLYGLLLALGEFKLDELPVENRKKAVDEISTWFANDPSSSMHGVTGWLLRQWGQTEVVTRVDQRAMPFDPNREWFTLVIESGEQRFY